MRVTKYTYKNIVYIPYEDKYNLIPFVNKVYLSILEHNSKKSNILEHIDFHGLWMEGNRYYIDYKDGNLVVSIAWLKCENEIYREYIKHLFPIDKENYDKCRKEFIYRFNARCLDSINCDGVTLENETITDEFFYA